jgi:hypothetical protein
MRQRCKNPNHPAYDDYGGREKPGPITVYEDWDNDFQSFFADVGDRTADGLTLDRIDNDGPYAPWNIRWATAFVQVHNRRRKRKRKRQAKP